MNGAAGRRGNAKEGAKRQATEIGSVTVDRDDEKDGIEKTEEKCMSQNEIRERSTMGRCRISVDEETKQGYEKTKKRTEKGRRRERQKKKRRERENGGKYAERLIDV